MWLLFQGLVAFAVFSANIFFGWTTNGYIAGGWAFLAAYALTVFPFTVYDWWKYRHVRRAEYAMKKKAGVPYGWRRHLPWNSRAASLAAVRVSNSVLDEPVLPNRPGGRLRGQGRPNARA